MEPVYSATGAPELGVRHRLLSVRRAWALIRLGARRRSYVKRNKKAIARRVIATIALGVVLPVGAALAQTQPGFDQREAERQKKTIEQ